MTPNVIVPADHLDMESVFRSLTEQSPFSTQIHTVDGSCIFVNRAWERLWGVTLAQIQGYNILEDQQLVEKGVMPQIRRAFAGETVAIPPIKYETELTRPGAGATPYRWVTAHMFPILDGEGRVALVAMTGEDVTARMEAEAQVREAEEQYRSIFIATSDGLIINDPETGVVVEANPAVCRMHGFSYEEFIGLHASAFIHPDFHPVFEEFRRTIEAGGTYQTQAVDLRKDGSAFHVGVHGSPLMFRGRRHILAVVRDITERMQSRELLERRVEERTREVYEQAQALAALEERQRLARELHDSVSQALYGIALGAHTARMLLDRDVGRIKEPLDYILSLAQEGLAEMRSLILQLRPEALEAEGLIAALGKHAAALQARYDIEIENRLGEEPAAPLPVKEALYRIGQEALHNAAKHAAARRVLLLLERQSGGLALEVRDDGMGFDPLGSFPGHLGMQTMRERAAGLGGVLEVESGAGSGTCVRAWIPCEGG